LIRHRPRSEPYASTGARSTSTRSMYRAGTGISMIRGGRSGASFRPLAVEQTASARTCHRVSKVGPHAVGRAFLKIPAPGRRAAVRQRVEHQSAWSAPAGTVMARSISSSEKWARKRPVTPPSHARGRREISRLLRAQKAAGQRREARRNSERNDEANSLCTRPGGALALVGML